MLQLLLCAQWKNFSCYRGSHSSGKKMGFSLSNQWFASERREHQSAIFGFRAGVLASCRQVDLAVLSEVPFMKGVLESYNPVNAICPEDAELALVIAAEIDKTTTAPASAGQRDLVD